MSEIIPGKAKTSPKETIIQGGVNNTEIGNTDLYDKITRLPGEATKKIIETIDAVQNQDLPPAEAIKNLVSDPSIVAVLIATATVNTIGKILNSISRNAEKNANAKLNHAQADVLLAQAEFRRVNGEIELGYEALGLEAVKENLELPSDKRARLASEREAKRRDAQNEFLYSLLAGTEVNIKKATKFSVNTGKEIINKSKESLQNLADRAKVSGKEFENLDTTEQKLVFRKLNDAWLSEVNSAIPNRAGVAVDFSNFTINNFGVAKITTYLKVEDLYNFLQVSLEIDKQALTTLDINDSFKLELFDRISSRLIGVSLIQKGDSVENIELKIDSDGKISTNGGVQKSGGEDTTIQD